MSVLKKCPIDLSPTPQHTTQKTTKKHFGATVFSSSPYADAGPIAITVGSMPTNLTGNLSQPLVDTPLIAICTVFITFNEISTVLHHSGFITVSIVPVASPFMLRLGRP